MGDIKALEQQNFTRGTGPVSVVSYAGPGAMTPMDMLAKAVQSGAGIEVLEKLMALQERWEANQARMEFNEAIASAKAEIKPIVKNRTGHNSKKYADMAAVANGVDPILAKYGLSYRYRSAQTDTKLIITCILFHKRGHQDEVPLSAGPDKTGNKNDIQAVGSSATYLERYTLMLALGLAAAEDDDGHAAGMGEVISDEQMNTLFVMAQEVGANLPAFCKLLKVESLDKLPARQFDSAVALLKSKRKSEPKQEAQS